MMNLIVGVDMDNTLGDFTSQFIRYVTNMGYEFDVNIGCSVFELETGIVDTTKEEQAQIINEILYEDDFWLTMKPLLYASKFLEWLNHKVDLKIVTTPWRFEDKFYNTKKEWMYEHFPFIKENQIVFNAKKWELDLDIVIDDKPSTIERAKAEGMVTILYDQPYNRNTPSHLRLNHWYNLPVVFKQALYIVD